MRAVWSFWTKPYKNSRKSIWFSNKHHLLSWVLSVKTVRQHYPNTALFTDREGVQILVDGIGLEFDQISTDLDVLAEYDPQWWALGKVYTYRAQTEPLSMLTVMYISGNPYPREWSRLHCWHRVQPHF